VPNTFGTRVAQPCRTRREAETAGKILLVSALAWARQPKEPADPVFLLHDYAIKLYQGPLDWMDPEMLQGFGSAKAAEARIEAILAELFPNGFDSKKIAALPDDDLLQLMAVLQVAALTGVFRYPPLKDGSPSGHQVETLSQGRH
jgi:hypothetical protein